MGMMRYYRCRFCGWRCVSLGRLSAHLRQVHPEDYEILVLRRKVLRLLNEILRELGECD